MKNFFKVQESETELTTRNFSDGKLYVAYINKAMVALSEVDDEYTDYYYEDRLYKASVFNTSDEPGFVNQRPLILSQEEEALLYDKYY